MSYSQPIRAEDAGAIEQLKARIAEAEQLQEKMKATNKIVRDRRLTDEQKTARLKQELGWTDRHGRELLQPDFAGRTGFPNYQLTNNAANIRRMQARVEALGKESARPTVAVEFPGGRMEDNAEDCRVRIYHDAKPGPETIEKLKANGFHWSPSLKCWQRLRNDSARWAATRVTGVSWPEANAQAAGAVPFQAPTVATVRPVAPQQRMGLSA